MKRFLIIHYAEIGLKGANKDYFVGKLNSFVKLRLEKKFRKTFVVKHSLGRLMTLLHENFEEAEYVEILKRIPGVKNFKFCYEADLLLDKLAEEVWRNLPNSFLEAGNGEHSFKVSVKRSMTLPFKSFEAERDIGAVLLEKGLNMRVSLKSPDFVVDIEFFNDHGYFSFKKYSGIGGFPPASQSKLVAMISSGFDSPVAAYMMMRRGARVIFVHFHGYPYTDKDEIAQVKDLVKILSEYQLNTKLYLVPFGKIQRSIATNLDVPARYRTVLYRRTMLRIAQEIAHKEQAKGLITGDSYGQVASQTPENIFAIHQASIIPLFQPLIGFDKEEITQLAEKIGTYDISKLPCKDTCTMFMPKSPEIRAKISEVKKFEESLPIDDFVSEAMAGLEQIVL